MKFINEYVEFENECRDIEDILDFYEEPYFQVYKTKMGSIIVKKSFLHSSKNLTNLERDLAKHLILNKNYSINLENTYFDMPHEEGYKFLKNYKSEILSRIKLLTQYELKYFKPISKRRFSLVFRKSPQI